MVLQARGVSILVDFATSQKNDLSIPSRWTDVETLAAVSSFVGIDIPCNTWSRARRVEQDALSVARQWKALDGTAWPESP